MTLQKTSVKNKHPLLSTLAEKTISHRKAVVIIVLILTVISAVLITLVPVNYNIVGFLPENAPSTTALNVLNNDFGDNIAGTQIMVRNISLAEALEVKKEIQSVDGVTAVSWLDDFISLAEPLSAADPKTVEKYYQNNNALYSVTVNKETATETITALQELLGNEADIIGSEASTAYTTNALSHDLLMVLAIGVPLIFLILLLTTGAWIEPALFLLTIGCAVIINMGTNIIFGEIAFTTQAVASILQLAVSMDYAIFLLHRFTEYQAEGLTVTDAMKSAVVSSFSSITSSGITTIAGFLALMFMSLGLGPDMGRVMMKGIIISLICVFTFLPAIAVMANGLIIKTKHRSFLPSKKTMKKLAKGTLRLGIPMIIIVAAVLVPSVMAVSNSGFIYVGIYEDNKTSIGQSVQNVDSVFGKTSQLVLMVEKGDPATEVKLISEIKQIPAVTDVMSYTETVGASIPYNFLDKDITDLFYSDKYSRILITVSGSTESSEAQNAVAGIRAAAEKEYSGNWVLAGENANTYDIRSYSQADYLIVNYFAIVCILLILLITFRNLILPVVLVMTIETGIWINCAIPFFTGEPFYYIAYLIITSLQLGATVDYAILLTNRYLELRKVHEKKEAAVLALSTSAVSILTSAVILFTAGITLLACSSISLLGQEGAMIGRGALLSVVMVLCILPTLLILLDKPIQKTTFHLKKKEVKI